MIKKILIVEDEEDIIELLSTIFDDPGGYKVLFARDGEEALRMAQSNIPHIVLLDILLPKLNGYQVCKLIKSDPAMSRTKIIMLSGMVQNSDRLKALEAGADGYIAKPFNSNTLVDKVEELLRSH